VSRRFPAIALVTALLLAAPAFAAPAAPPTSPDAAASAAIPAAEAARLREVQTQVLNIKAGIFEAKRRLIDLAAEIVDKRPRGQSRLVLVHDDRMGAAFSPQRVTYFLDGKKVFARRGHKRTGAVEVYAGAITPGNHSLSVEAIYRGNSALFPYLQGYAFKVRSSYTFYAAKRGTTRVNVIPFERTGMDTAFEDRPSVRYEVQALK